MDVGFSLELGTLERHLQNAREKKILSDITIVCENGDLLYAHKIVLVSTSSFLKDLLLSAAIEDPNKIILDGITSFYLRHILQYLYTGQMKVKKELVYEVIKTAEQLGLNNLAELKSSLEITQISNWQTEKQETQTVALEDENGGGGKHASGIKNTNTVTEKGLRKPLNGESELFEETSSKHWRTEQAEEASSTIGEAVDD